MDYSSLLEKIDNQALAKVIEALPNDFGKGFSHGDLPGWITAIEALPTIRPNSFELIDKVRIGEAEQCTSAQRKEIVDLLLCLQPWRKGPYELFGIDMDTEWRSDWKWNRLKEQISPLDGRVVLDVGCGNGYHCWRMAGAGAKVVLGIDSHLLFTMQYWALRHFLTEPPVYVAPLALEDLPAQLNTFDTVFSMGVLYHRRSPLDHLFSLKECLRPGGELVLETLVIDGEVGMSLVPQGRYARMPNVWFLPTCATLENWLKKAGFKNPKLVDISTTSPEEQRSTKWMQFESLEKALDVTDSKLTIEGYPAPKRAVFIAEKAF